jgi:hypothetical protein
MRFNMAGTAEEAGQFARDIAIVAQANVQLHGDVGAALQQVQLTIANQSTMRLDQLGLSVSSVTKRIKELQESTPGLSRELAFQQAVMDGLHEEANMLGDDFLAVGSNTAQVKTQMRELREEIGVKVSNAMETAAKSALELQAILGELGAKETVVRIVTEVAGQTAGSGTENWLNLIMVGPMLAARQAGLIGPQEKPSSTTDIYGANLPPVGSQLAGGNVSGSYYPDGSGGWIWVADQSAENFLSHPEGPDPNATVTGMYLTTPSGDLVWTDLTPSTGGRGAPTSLLYPGMPGYEQSRSAQAAAGFMGPAYNALGGGGGQTGVWFEAQRALSEFISESQDLAGVWAQDITGAVQTVAGALSDSLSTTSDMVSGAQDVAAEFDRLKNMSLDQVLGIDAGQFATDVGGEMAKALRDAGVDAEITAEAMRKYELQTGLATAASDVFGGRMAALAEELAKGNISVNDYLATVQKLSTTDMSWLDDIFGGLVDTAGIDAATAFLDRISSMNPENMQGVAAFANDPFGAMGDVSGYGGMTPESAAAALPLPIYHVLDEVSGRIDAIDMQFTSVFSPTREDLTFNDDPTLQGIERVSGRIDAIDQQFASAFGKTYDVHINVIPDSSVTVTIPIGGGAGGGGQSATPSTGPSSAGGVPEFASGGYTGDSGDPFMALLHRREYVIPEDRLRSGGGAGGSSRVVVENHLYMDSREIAAAQSQQNRLRNSNDR